MGAWGCGWEHGGAGGSMGGEDGSMGEVCDVWPFSSHLSEEA